MIAGQLLEISSDRAREWVRFYAGRWEILFVQRGRVEVSYNGKKIELSGDGNNFLIYKPGFSYRFKVFDRAVYLYAHFNLRSELAEKISFPETFEGLGCFALASRLRRQVKRDLLEIIRLVKLHHTNWDALALLLAESILLRVSSVTSENSDHAPKLLNAYILLGKMEDIPIRTVAKQCGLSVPILYRLFKQETGKTPRAYHEGVKLREAARLLQETDLSLEEIASKINMYDQYYLSKRFKKYSGDSPSLYRRKSRRS